MAPTKNDVYHGSPLNHIESTSALEPSILIPISTINYPFIAHIYIFLSFCFVVCDFCFTFVTYLGFQWTKCLRVLASSAQVQGL